MRLPQTLGISAADAFQLIRLSRLLLPVALAGFFLQGRWGRTPAVAWLSAMSLVFYGSWYPTHVPLLVASMLANWWVGRRLAARPSG